MTTSIFVLRAREIARRDGPLGRTPPEHHCDTAARVTPQRVASRDFATPLVASASLRLLGWSVAMNMPRSLVV